METAYLVCATIGGTLIVCQFLMTILGLGGHHDVGGHDAGGDAGGHDMVGHETGGHDASGHHEASQQSEPNWFFSQLTFRTLTAAFAFFGLAPVGPGRASLAAAHRMFAGDRSLMRSRKGNPQALHSARPDRSWFVGWKDIRIHSLPWAVPTPYSNSRRVPCSGSADRQSVESGK